MDTAIHDALSHFHGLQHELRTANITLTGYETKTERQQLCDGRE